MGRTTRRSPNVPTSSWQPFPDSLGGGSGIHKFDTRVPKDQQKLLEKHDAWAETMKSAPHGPVNLPAKDLETLIQFHARNAELDPSEPSSHNATSNVAREQQSPTSIAESRPGAPKGPSNAPKKGLKTHIPNSPEGRPASSSSSSSSSDGGTEHSWSQSPPEQAKRTNTVEVSNTAFAGSLASSAIMSQEEDNEQMTDVSDGSGSSPSPPHRSKRAMATSDVANSSPIRSRQTSTGKKRQYIKPDIATQVSVPDINITPSEVAKSSIAVENTSALRSERSRELKLPPTPFNFPPSDAEDSEVEELVMQPPLPLAHSILKHIDRVAKPTPTPPSAQIVPCTEVDVNSQEAHDKRRKLKTAAPLFEKYLSPKNLRKAVQGDKVHRTQATRGQELEAPEFTISSRVSHTQVLSQTRPSTADSHAGKGEKGVDAGSNAGRPLAGTRHSTTRHVPAPIDQSPLGQFRVAYPDYPGSLNEFLRAISTLEWLVKEGALAVVLYDDFVGFYSHRYMPHVQTLRDSTPPPAGKWYNTNMNKLLYTKGIIDKNMIDRIRDHYKSEIADIMAEIQSSSPAKTPRLFPREAPDSPRVEHGDVDMRDGRVEDEEEYRDAPATGHRSRTTGSPDISTPAPSDNGRSMGSADRPRIIAKAFSFAASGVADLPPSSLPEVVIPNTFVSMLEANAPRIPETVRKPERNQSRFGGSLTKSFPPPPSSRAIGAGLTRLVGKEAMARKNMESPERPVRDKQMRGTGSGRVSSGRISSGRISKGPPRSSAGQLTREERRSILHQILREQQAEREGDGRIVHA